MHLFKAINFLKKNILSFFLFSLSLIIFYSLNYYFIKYVTLSNLFAILILFFSRYLITIFLRLFEIEKSLINKNLFILLFIFLPAIYFIGSEFIQGKSIGNTVSMGENIFGIFYYIAVSLCAFLNYYSLKITKIK